MKLAAVKLRFKTPLHLSKGKLDTYESSEYVLRSDTLHAALFVTTLELLGGGYANQLLEQLVVSSAFPFSESGYWLPRPFWFQLDDVENRKQLKKKRYLTFDQFQRLMLGERVNVEELKATPDPAIWESTTTQRVLLDRVHLRGTPFFLEKLYPKHDSQGLYVLVAMSEEMPWLDGVFKLLGDNGIGLQRNLGNGLFEHEWVNDFPEFCFPRLDQIQWWLNLSLFRPSLDELNSSILRLDKSIYTMIKRGGWIATPEHSQFATLRKKSVMMFEEGSAFQFSGMNNSGVWIKGEVANLRPEWNDPLLHPVWRSGKALFLPIGFS